MEVISIISAATQTPSEQLNDQSSPSSVDRWDSINNLTIITDLEEKFNVTFSIDDIFEMQTIGEICNKIQNLCSK